MPARTLTQCHPGLLVLLTVAAGCSSPEQAAPAEATRTVQGALAAEQLAALDVPSVVAQDTNGQTFDGPVSADGTFKLDLPTGRIYRLFVTELRASGRQAAVSRVLWPGKAAWVSIAPATGSTRDGPISVGTIRPSTVTLGGTTTDGTSVATGNGGGAGGGATARGNAGGAAGSTATTGDDQGQSTAAGGATTGGANVAHDGHGGGGDGRTGSGGASATASGDHGEGSPSVCLPAHQSVSECSGAHHDLNASTGPQNEAALAPTCTAPGTATTGAGTTDGASSSGAASGLPSQPGAPQCEHDKHAIYEKGRWDCVKMETPVTYFYSDKPIKVKAAVAFPGGLLTQWYPSVVDSYPVVAGEVVVAPSGAKGKVCSTVLGSIGAGTPGAAANGLLDWGTIDVLGRAEALDAKLPAAALDRYTWSFARQVAANPLRVSSGQIEKFLFYRGIGNFSLPVRVAASGGGQLALTNLIGEAIGPVFYLNVQSDKGAFAAAMGGISPGKTALGAIPTLDRATNLEAYADALATSVRSSLDETGLYNDEATAMVNTWKRQWFRTPGARLLYIVPQSWTDRSIPLSIEPKPEDTRRVMVIRVEIITPELEAADTSALRLLAVPATASQARDHFTRLGRFAEPRLRRAMTLLGHPSYAERLLGEVVVQNHTTHEPSLRSRPLKTDPAGRRYPGKGFVVHEWGTDTIVVGSDGSQLLGLQHEEEDLPRFVYDRTRREGDQ